MSSVNGLVFLVNKQTRHISYAGDVPEAYASITGLRNIDYSILSDLHTTFRENESDPRFLHLGFLTEADALAAGVTPEEVRRQKTAAWEIKWNSLGQERQDLISDQRWRVDRYNDELAMGLEPTEPVGPVLAYIQAIRDLPSEQVDPYNIVWPTIPPLGGA
jgi:hypothetical protein